MLCTLTKDRFSRDDWLYERKLDGERVLAFRDAAGVNLMSRNKKSLNSTYPEIVAALEGQEPGSFIVDGEVVALKGDETSFAALQERMQVMDPEEALSRGIKIYYYLFDILYLDGYDITNLELIRRKELLKGVIRFTGPLKFLEHTIGHGIERYKEACASGWEGLIAKYARGTYQHRRSAEWLKFKCINRQEFVIGGYTEPHGKRSCLGAILVGYYRDDRLMYAGKVGTGYSDEILKFLCGLFSPLVTDRSPFENNDVPTREVNWLKPELVAEIGFAEWTRYDKLRQPRFIGIRNDKDPKDVVKEG